MYCIKVTPGTERIRVRSISSGFLPSYAPAADPDAPFAFSDADGAFVASSGKNIRKLVVPGYVFSLQRSPRAKQVDPEEWKIIDALSDSRTSVFDSSGLKFTEGPLMGLENLVVQVGSDHVQIKAVLLEAERTYYVPVTIAPEELAEAERIQQTAVQKETPVKTEDKEMEEVYSQDRIDVILADAENIGIHAAGRKYEIPWQTIISWKKKKAKAADAPKQEKVADRKGKKASGRKSAGEKNPGRKKAAEMKATAAAEDEDAAKEADPLEIENAMLRERVASLESKIEKMKKAIADLM